LAMDLVVLMSLFQKNSVYLQQVELVRLTN
jgi:hypothetical protein